MSDILFIEPQSLKERFVCKGTLKEPLDLEYAAASLLNVLPESDNVAILDMRIENSLEESLCGVITNNSEKIFAVCVVEEECQRHAIFKLFCQLKMLLPEIVTIVGGYCAFRRPEVFQYPLVDIVMHGSPENILEKIVLKSDLADIKGISFFYDGNWKITSPALFPLSDDLAFPARHLTQKYRKHYSYKENAPAAWIKVSSGCPYSCSFCVTPTAPTEFFQKRKLENIVDEIKTIQEENIVFTNQENMVDGKWMKDLAVALKESGIRKKYYIKSRPSSVLANPHLFSLWKSIGLVHVSIGIESLEQKRLDSVSKELTVEECNKALNLLEGIDLEYSPSFLIFPDFSKKDFKKLKSYVRKRHIKTSEFRIITPMPGTPFFEENKDRILFSNPEKFDCFHSVLSTKLSAKIFYKEYNKLCK